MIFLLKRRVKPIVLKLICPQKPTVQTVLAIIRMVHCPPIATASPRSTPSSVLPEFSWVKFACLCWSAVGVEVACWRATLMGNTGWCSADSHGTSTQYPYRMCVPWRICVRVIIWVILVQFIFVIPTTFILGVTKYYFYYVFYFPGFPFHAFPRC